MRLDLSGEAGVDAGHLPVLLQAKSEQEGVSLHLNRKGFYTQMSVKENKC